ncbi:MULTISPECIES: stage II sporulation protein M [Vitreoscilla]|uniref:Stage II sporulation protein M n=1 Tax=Vitreoscilla stercoraria TaxID=61 RepID=A0ABY4ED28_VITST|nr:MULTISPECIES: stage II sporulation protein M [Vitreoscilla]AUZ06082.2 integral membrane protein [Vitreoscilla sp. C1]UOO92553.1 stage II sporulation protein M [Vitreoscilla stercoraria]
MRQHLFESAHQDFWQRFDAMLTLLERKKNLPQNANQQFGQHYRTICHHLALANSRNYSAGLCQKLQKLVDRAHKQLYQSKVSFWNQFLEFIQTTLPQTVRQQKTVMLWGHLLFYVPFLLCYLLTLGNPDFFDQLAGPNAGAQIGDAYSEMAALQAAQKSRPWGQNWMMFGFYIMNNISIGFQSFVGGLVLGLGAIYVAVFNGAVIGAAFGYMSSHPAGPVFFSFVGAHGSFELTGIVLSVAGGLKIGYTLIHPGNYSRRDALSIEGKPAATLICGAFLFLFIAALIEGFWSPITVLPLWLKYSVALILWLGVYAYLFWYQAAQSIQRRPE